MQRIYVSMYLSAATTFVRKKKRVARNRSQLRINYDDTFRSVPDSSFALDTMNWRNVRRFSDNEFQTGLSFCVVAKLKRANRYFIDDIFKTLVFVPTTSSFDSFR